MTLLRRVHLFERMELPRAQLTPAPAFGLAGPRPAAGNAG